MVREKTRSGVLDERIIETLESRPEWITSRVPSLCRSRWSSGGGCDE